MKNSAKIYVIYVAAVLAVGSVYMYFQHDDKAIKPEKGNVTMKIILTIATISVNIGIVNTFARFKLY